MAGLLLRRDPFCASGLPVSLTRRRAVSVPKVIFSRARGWIYQSESCSRVCFIGVDEVPSLILSAPWFPVVELELLFSRRVHGHFDANAEIKYIGALNQAIYFYVDGQIIFANWMLDWAQTLTLSNPELKLICDILIWVGIMFWQDCDYLTEKK